MAYLDGVTLGGTNYKICDPNNAEEFSPDQPYVVGKYVNYEGTVYKFTTAHAAGAWNAAHATAVILTKELDELKSALADRTINIVEGWKYGALTTNGEFNPNPSSDSIVTSDYIACTPNTKYYAVCPSGRSIRIAQYDSNKAFINFLGYFANNVFTTGATTEYIRGMVGGMSEFDKTIGINTVQDDINYAMYWPYLDSHDYTARGEARTNTEIVNKISATTGNIWDEAWEYGYLNANGQNAAPSTPAFRSKNYIPVEPSTAYYAVVPTASIRVAQYDSNHNFISYLGYITNSTFTTGASTAYIRFWSGAGASYSGGISIKPTTDSDYNVYTPYLSAVDYVARAKLDKITSDYVTVGTNGDYPTVVAGFSAAITQDKGCIILPGVYDLVSEGASAGVGITAPKHVIGYGAKIVANLSAENWAYSAINMSTQMDEVIIEGLEIEVTNCRYCVHDEEYNRPGYYHHVFKNCKMTHNSQASETLIRPVCIGGGFGNSCLVEIESCEFSSMDANNNDANYHANATGQTGNCIVKCKDSVFKTSIGITGNAQTGFMNEMFVSNCLCNSIPIVSPGGEGNSKMTQWNNVVRN